MIKGYEAKALEAYETLKALASDHEAPPCVACNARRAAASVWQIVNDLGLVFEQLYEYEV